LGCLILGVGLYLTGFASSYWFPIGATGIVSIGTALTITYAARTSRYPTGKITTMGIGIAGLLLLLAATIFYVVYAHLPLLVSGMGLSGLGALIISHIWSSRYAGSTKEYLLLTLIHGSSVAVMAAILLDMSFIVRTALVGGNLLLVVAFSAVQSQADAELDREQELTG
jgi:hypothetical protein